MKDIVENVFVVWTEDHTADIAFWKNNPMPEEVEQKVRESLEVLKDFPQIEYIAQIVERYHDTEKLEERIDRLEKFRHLKLPESSPPVQDAVRMVEDAKHDSVVLKIIDVKPINLPNREKRLGMKSVQLMFRGNPYLRVLTEEEIKERKIKR